MGCTARPRMMVRASVPLSLSSADMLSETVMSLVLAGSAGAYAMLALTWFGA